MFEVLAARDPAENHALGDPELLGTDGEVDVRNHQADEGDAADAVQHVGEAPRRVGEKIRVACEQRVADAVWSLMW